MVNAIIKNKSISMLDAKDYTLETYFLNYEKIIIPLYQRGYSWEDKNMEVFIKDIYNNGNYYIGNIMTLPHNKSIELIDGQQRIISSFLILCCLKNKFNVEFDMKLLSKGKKIEIETRAPSNDSRLLEFIYNDDIPENYLDSKEVKEYKKAFKTIEINKFDPIILFNKLMKVYIVEICFTNSETDAHNMFVNLNTKGKSLENIDILKSQLFKYLSYDEIKGIEYYKEGWYQTIKQVEEKNAQRYFDNFNDIFLENSKDKKIDNAIAYISNLMKAKEYFDEFRYESDQKNGLCKCAMTVYNHSISYLNNIYDGNISLIALDNYLKLLEKAKFKQFDVVLIPMLHIRNNIEKVNFINNYNLILKFIKFILMHQEIMAINKSSPSQYGNDFKTIGRNIFVEKNYKMSIKKFLENNLKKHDEKYIKETIKNIKIDHDNTKHAKQIIMLISENIKIDMTIEHFLPCRQENAISLSIGNCIPVNIDEYGETNVENKLKKYNLNSNFEPYIKDFLNHGIDKENYLKKIEERTNEIIDKYADIYTELYLSLTE